MKLNKNVCKKIESVLASGFNTSQELFVIVKKQAVLYADFVAYVAKTKAINDSEPLKVLLSYMHEKLAWPAILDKYIGLNIRENQLTTKAVFCDEGGLVIKSLSDIELSQYQAILFYDGLRRHLQADRTKAYQQVVMSHVDNVEKLWEDSGDKDALLLGHNEDCLSDLVKQGFVEKGKEKQEDRAVLAFFLECANRGYSVTPSTDTGEDTDQGDMDDENIPEGHILLKSDANIMKAVAGLIDNAQLSDDDIEQAWTHFEKLCGFVGVDYSDTIATLEGDNPTDESEETAQAA